MRIAIRADASRQLGFGHVKRCLALAAALREAGAELRFFAAASDVDVAAMVRSGGFAFSSLDSVTDLAELGAWAPDVAVVDHYQLDATWHAALRAATAARIAVIDDLADRPLAADLVIDHNPVADMAAKYRAVLRQPASLCGGLAYAMLDAVYAGHARHALHDTVRSIGIFMGGTDAENFSVFAWQACRTHASWQGPIEIASTSANPSLPALRALCAADPNTTLRIDQPHLADFHVRHDLQIGAGGGASWERCCLGVPAVVLICADNQCASVPPLAAAGAAVALDARGQGDVRRAELGVIVRRLIDSPAERLALHQQALRLVDGRGAQRVAAEVIKLAP